MNSINNKIQTNKSSIRFFIDNIKNNSNNNTLNKNLFEFKYIIGKGGFGKVWQVLYKKTRELFALKEMSKQKILDKKSEKFINNELLLLKKLYHPFIVNMHYAFQDNYNLYLVIDFCAGGDLRYHCSRYRIFSEEQTRFFISCIIFGLGHIHENNIIHRDIKPENLVLDSKGYVHITDFGIALEINNDNSHESSGTPGYMSPEVMIGKKHSFPADYFALGVITYEFMMGQRPFNGKDRKEIKEQMFSKEIKLKKSDIKNGWSIESFDFINHLLERKPEKRLGNENGVTELKEHQWLKYYPWKELGNKELPSPFLPDQNDNFDKGYCISSEILTENTKLRYKKIYSNSKYKIAFKNFYFNKETEMRLLSKKPNKNNINKKYKDKDNILNKINKNINNKIILMESKQILKNNRNDITTFGNKMLTTDNINSITGKKLNNQSISDELLISIRKILYETNDETMYDNNKEKKYNNNYIIKERIFEHLSNNFNKNNSKNLFIKKNILYKKEENKIKEYQINKKQVINKEAIHDIKPYYNHDSYHSPRIAISNLFLNYNNSAPKNINNKKDDFNHYNYFNVNISNNNKKGKILTPPHKQIFDISFHNKINKIFENKNNGLNNSNSYLSFINTKKSSSKNIINNIEIIRSPIEKYYLKKINNRNSEKSILFKNTSKLFNKKITNHFNISYNNKFGNFPNKEKNNYLIKKLMISNNN